MRALILLLLLPTSILAAEEKTLKLKYVADDKGDYSDQLEEAFAKLLKSDAALAKEFAKFEAAPPEDARGRYHGSPEIQPIMIRDSESVDFGGKGGKKEFGQTIALYYRFDEGFHRGRSTRSGFFALFTITGDLTYRRLANDEFELTNSLVVAKFKGFSRTLNAPKPDDE